MKVRKSHIEAWIRCPKLYELVYLKNIPFNVSVEMQSGKIFHEFARSFFLHIDYDELMKCKDITSTLKFLFGVIKHTPPVIEPLCKNFIQFEANRWIRLIEKYDTPVYYFKPVKLEYYYETKDVVPGVDGAGTVDRVDRNSEDNYVVIEYKTSKRLNRKTLKRELTWYALNLEKLAIFKRPFTHIACYNPRINQYFVARITERLRQMVRRRVLQLKRANEYNFYPPHESFLCRWCGALRFCSAKKNFMDWKAEEQYREEEEVGE